MAQNQLPVFVSEICSLLRESGFSAYPVGGCVRDLLLGRTPQDWDVTTSAQPQDVLSLFPHTVPTGIKHGTVTVLIGNKPVEVTSFRRDGDYSDGRRPDSVSFDADLTTDLSRRDFTINAMAWGPGGEIIDPFGGRIDLRAGLIRCVGEPEQRFAEDALRMLRAIRFSAQLGFAVEARTAQSLRRNAGRTGRLSAERVCAEVQKVLLSSWPERGERLFTWGLLESYAPGRPAPDLTTLHRVARAPLERWSALSALLLETRSISDAGSFLRALRLDRVTVFACAAAQNLRAGCMPRTAREWRHALSNFGIPACRAAAAAEDALTGAHSSTLLADILEAHAPIRAEDLALSGGELSALGYAGREIGAAQKLLLDHVLDRPEDNRREALLALLSETHFTPRARQSAE